jgi:hypothetical protein
MFYFVIFIQTAINTGIGIGAILLAGQCLEVCLLDLYLFDFFFFLISSISLSVYQQVRAALWIWLSFSQIFHHQMTDGMITVPQGLLLVNFGLKYNYIWRKR